MIRDALRAAIATLVLVILTGLAYPVAMTALGQAAFGAKADGSIVADGGHAVGSSLIGQLWTGPGWFHGRPSALAQPYDATTSSGSNLGPNARALADALRARVATIIELEGPYVRGLKAAGIPVDLLTASASGLDPHISPAAARLQAARIAAVRGLPLARVLQLIEAHVEGRTLGFLGEPRLNVLELNLALQQLTG